MNILVVDDDFINRKLIQAMLKRHPELVGEVVEAENGSEALSALKNGGVDIDIILLDILMPVLDGREFLKIFRADSSNDKIPVLVLSTDDTQKSTVMELGAAGFIIKPINEDESIEKIQEFTQL